MLWLGLLLHEVEGALRLWLSHLRLGHLRLLYLGLCHLRSTVHEVESVVCGRLLLDGLLLATHEAKGRRGSWLRLSRSCGGLRLAEAKEIC